MQELWGGLASSVSDMRRMGFHGVVNPLVGSVVERCRQLREGHAWNSLCLAWQCMLMVPWR